MGLVKRANKKLKRQVFSKPLLPGYKHDDGRYVYGIPGEIHTDILERTLFPDYSIRSVPEGKYKTTQQRAVKQLFRAVEMLPEDKLDEISEYQFGYFDPATGKKYTRRQAGSVVMHEDIPPGQTHRLDSLNKSLAPSESHLKNARSRMKGRPALALLAAAGLPTLLSQVRSNS